MIGDLLICIFKMAATVERETGQIAGIENQTMHRFEQYHICTMKTQGSHPVSNFEA